MRSAKSQRGNPTSSRERTLNIPRWRQGRGVEVILIFSITSGPFPGWQAASALNSWHSEEEDPQLPQKESGTITQPRAQSSVLWVRGLVWAPVLPLSGWEASGILWACLPLSSVRRTGWCWWSLKACNSVESQWFHDKARSERRRAYKQHVWTGRLIRYQKTPQPVAPLLSLPGG